MIKRQTLIPLLIWLPLTCAFGQRATLKIIPAENGWEGGGINDIKKVLYSSAQELWKYAYDQKLDPIIVHNAHGGPIVYYKRGRNNEYRVKLDTGGTYWSQYAFQFSHEFCHILCRYKEADKTNLWFEETLCETASLFSLRAMSKTWEKNPPYPNWKGYRTSLFGYAKGRIDAHALPNSQSLATWYKANADHLEKNATDRPKNTTAAIELLPLFEKTPANWGAVSFINTGRTKEPQSFATYLDNWQKNCPAEYKPFVQEIIGLFSGE
jgi:hypothetical protein